MLPFWSHNPTKIIFEPGALKSLGAQVAPFGRRALLVTGCGHFACSPAHAAAMESLRAAQVAVVEFPGVKSNPVVSHARDGIRLVRREGCDVVVAIGGGSVIDEAKIIAAGALADKDVWHFFSSADRAPAALPIIAVATMAATGSEFNGGVVLTNDATDEKAGIGSPVFYPKVSILDPELTVSVPRAITAAGIVDAFSHALEPYFNGTGAPVVQDNLCEGVLRSLTAIAPRLLGNLEDVEARGDMMWAACMAHDGRLNLGRGRVRFEIHAFAHAIGALFNVHHGAAIAITLPAWMSVALPHREERFAKFAHSVMAVHKAEPSSAATIGIRRLREWLEALEVPTSLGAIGIDAVHIPALTAKVVPMIAAGGLTSVDEDGVRRVFDAAM